MPSDAVVAALIRLADRAQETIEGLWRAHGRRTIASTRLGQAAKRRRREALRRALLPGPPQAVRFDDGEPLSRERLDELIDRAAERAGSDADVPGTGVPAPLQRRDAQDVLLISHCDFTAASALHVYAIASHLHAVGKSPVIAVPRGATGVRAIGRVAFSVVDYDTVRAGGIPRVDLVHAFSPRERVRKLTLDVADRYGSPYVVHLEDNDEILLERELGIAADELRRVPMPLLDAAVRAGSSHPLRAPAFLAGAAGVTVVIERLLERKPDDVPGVVVWPGFDEAVLAPSVPRERMRSELGLRPADVALVYTGNIHDSNEGEMLSLYEAVAQLRRSGLPVVLIKTGWNFVAASRFPKLDGGLRDLGYVARERVPSLLAAGDILVQPGCSDPFNDYRFPSKVPEFLASGRPVILPRTNIGLHLEDGVEALLLDTGAAEEIAAKVSLLVQDADLRTRLGARGREFALRELRWAGTVERIVELYGRALVHGGRRDLAEPGPPVRLVRRRAGDEPRPTVGSIGALSDESVLRQLVVRALERQEPVLVVDGQLGEQVLRTAIRRGIRQFYAARGYALSPAQAEAISRRDAVPPRRCRAPGGPR